MLTSGVIHFDINEKEYDNELIDSPLKLAYTLLTNDISQSIFFLTLDWSYKIINSFSHKVYFNLVVTTTYEINPETSATSFENLDEILIDGFKKLKESHEKRISKTRFINFSLLNLNQTNKRRKITEILEDIGTYQLR